MEASPPFFRLPISALEHKTKSMRTKELQLCEITVNYEPKRRATHQITSSKIAESYLRQAFKKKRSNIQYKEYFYILLLSRSNKVLAFHKLSEGAISGCLADIRLAFGVALKSVASAMILCHNHPSANCKPSTQDDRLTKKFKDAGELLDIAVLDHIILTHNDYYSYADMGKI